MENVQKQYSIFNPKNMNKEIFFNSLQEKTSDGDTIEYLIRNYISANNDFYDQEKHSIFNPKEKSAWDKLDIDIKENVVIILKQKLLMDIHLILMIMNIL